MADLSPLSGWAPELAAAFVSLASDIALVIDEGGVIRSVAVGDAGPSAHGWVGKPWVDTVTGDTRRKIELLLQDVSSAGIARRREVNHPAAAGADDIPVAYTAIRLGAQGPVLAVGRDLRAVAAIQQRFVDVQQEMEREYWRLRQAQTQHRLLDQAALDAVVVIDAQTLAPLQANPAARALFGEDTALPAAIEEMLVMARSTGRAAEVRTRMASGAVIELAATPFRATGAEPSQRLLVRARPTSPDAAAAGSDAVVVTDSAGRVMLANDTFARLVRSSTAPQGQPLPQLLGDVERSLAALLAEVRREGIVEAARVTVGDARQRLPLEVSAALIAEGDQECIGLTLRPLQAAAQATAPDLGRLVHEFERLLDGVGDMALPELMQHAAAVAERHAVATALARSAHDAVAAAALLGIPDAELRERVQRLGLDVA